MNWNQVRLDPACIPCLGKKYLNNVPAKATPEAKDAYTRAVSHILADAPATCSAPELVEQFTALQAELFGFREDLSEEKAHFNALMLEWLPCLRQRVQQADDPLALAMRYAMLGNYIDFAAMEKVEEEPLMALLEQAADLTLDDSEYATLRRELAHARRLVYLTDNCGEIALDRLFIEELQQTYPDLTIEAIVRGKPVHNDATLDDARQVGLDTVVPVFPNGTAIAGTCLERISAEAKEKIQQADLLISKGQGNFESLHGCGLNVYYLFLCKCEMFARRFDVPLFTGMLVNDRRL